MQSIGLSIMLNTSKNSYLVGIFPFNWSFGFNRIDSPVIMVSFRLGPLMISVNRPYEGKIE